MSDLKKGYTSEELEVIYKFLSNANSKMKGTEVETICFTIGSDDSEEVVFISNPEIQVLNLISQE